MLYKETIDKFKEKIKLFPDVYQQRLRCFLHPFEKTKAEYISNFILEKKIDEITLVAGGLPIYLFGNISNINFLQCNFISNEYGKVIDRPRKRTIDALTDGSLEKKDIPLISIEEDELIELSIDPVIKRFKIKLVDYSPIMVKFLPIIKELFPQIDFEYYDRNVNFTDIKEITKNTTVIIPNSEYLYLLNELDLINDGDYFIAFNQKDDDEKRKVNTVMCLEDFLEQLPCKETILKTRIDVSKFYSYLVIGKK